MRSRLSSSARTDDIRRGISAAMSPRSRVRSAWAGRGGSLRMPLKARMRVSPTMPRSSVKILEVRSQRASFCGTSITMRTLPLSASSIRRTRPIGKPENVMSMPTITPSESSEVSTSCWVCSNTPRANITYSTKPTMVSATVVNKTRALRSRLAMWGTGSLGGRAGLVMGAVDSWMAHMGRAGHLRFYGQFVRHI